MQNTKKFGLSIACSIAASAIKNDVAPISTIIANLLSLQRSKIFPSKLEEHDFIVLKHNLTDLDRKIIPAVIDKVRSPHSNTAVLLENIFGPDWVVKIKQPQQPNPSTKGNVRKNSFNRGNSRNKTKL